MLFKHFNHPERYSTLLDEATVCSICAGQKICFDAAGFLGEESITAICPDCLAGGGLKGRDIYTCEGDIVELTKQLQHLHLDLPAAAITEMARQKTEELEKTTPRLITWQDWEWPCAEGDYSTFLGYGSKALYNRLATGKDGAWLFQLSLYHSVKEEGDADELWEYSMPKKDIPDYAASRDLSTLFYVFKSLHSDQIITVWDEP